MTLEAKLVNKLPTPKPLKNLHKTTLQPSLKLSNKGRKQWLLILIKVERKALKKMKRECPLEKNLHPLPPTQKWRK